MSRGYWMGKLMSMLSRCLPSLCYRIGKLLSAVECQFLG
jgi:hypothetical protein